MAISITCPACGTQQEFPDALAAKQAFCRHCGQALMWARPDALTAAIAARDAPPEPLEPPPRRRRAMIQGSPAQPQPSGLKLGFGIGCGIIAAFLLVPFGLILVFMLTGPKPGPKPSLAPLTRKKATEQMQKERVGMLAEAINLGFIQTVKGEQLWVNPSFRLLDFDKKEFLANLAFCYAFEVETSEKGNLPDNAVLELIDGKTGKRIGRYALFLGGLKLD